MKPNPHPVPSSVRKRFIDFFQRDNTTSGLGRAFLGGTWDFIRGSFKLENFRATTDDLPEDYPITDYPLATVTMPTESVTLDLYDIQNGSAAGLWVTDSGDWFAVGVDQHPVDCNCSTGTECNRWNGSNITGWTTRETGGRNSFTVVTGEFCQTNETGGRNAIVEVVGKRPSGETRCTAYDRVGSFRYCYEWIRLEVLVYAVTGYNAPNFSTTCNTNFATRYNAPNFTSNINGYNANECNRWNEFLFDCETCYPQWVRILQSVGGTVTTLVKVLANEVITRTTSPNGTLSFFKQDNPITKFVRSLIINTDQDTISVQAFADPELEDKISLENGDITYTPTGAQITPNYGIMVVPSEYQQDNQIGGIVIRREGF